MYGKGLVLTRWRAPGEEYRTGTKKGTYDPEWNERVELGWSKSGPEAGSLLRVVLYDEDLTGKDEIGEASLDACLLYRLRVGEEKEVVLGVRVGGGGVLAYPPGKPLLKRIYNTS